MGSYTIRKIYRRGCGWRRAGGTYLVSGHLNGSCGLFPFSLHVCPTCGEGVRQSRAWTWINPIELTKKEMTGPPSRGGRLSCSVGLGQGAHSCTHCPSYWGEKAGLIWVGGAYYDTTQKFLDEAVAQGISRRVTAVPRGFELGKTWVLLAHASGCGPDQPGIFAAYKPTAIERVLKPDERELLQCHDDIEDPEDREEWINTELSHEDAALLRSLLGMIKRGITLVHDVRIGKRGKEIKG